MCVYIAIIITILAILSSGFSIAQWVFKEAPDSCYITGLKYSIALALGLAFWSSSYAMLLFMGESNSHAIFLKDIAFAIGGLFFLGYFFVKGSCRRESMRPVKLIHRPRVFWLLFIAALLVWSFIYFGKSFRTPEGEWDAWTVWNLRARFLFRSGNDLATVFSPEIPWSNPDHPLLLPGLIAQTWMMMAKESVIVPIAIGWIFAILSAGILVFALAALRGIKTGLVAGLVFLGIPIFVTIAAAQYADVVIGTYVLIAFVSAAVAFENITNQAVRFLILSGLAISVAIWTKNEGALYGLSLIVALWFFGRNQSVQPSRRFRNIFWLMIGTVPLGILIIYFKLTYAPPDDFVSRFSFADMPSRIIDFHRYNKIFLEVVRRLFWFEEWNVFLICLPILGYLWSRSRPKPISAKIVGGALGLVLLGFGTIYLLTPYDLHWYISNSMDRLLIQCWPSLIFATFLYAPKVDVVLMSNQSKENCSVA